MTLSRSPSSMPSRIRSPAILPPRAAKAGCSSPDFVFCGLPVSTGIVLRGRAYHRGCSRRACWRRPDHSRAIASTERRAAPARRQRFGARRGPDRTHPAPGQRRPARWTGPISRARGLASRPHSPPTSRAREEAQAIRGRTERGPDGNPHPVARVCRCPTLKIPRSMTWCAAPLRSISDIANVRSTSVTMAPAATSDRPVRLRSALTASCRNPVKRGPPRARHGRPRRRAQWSTDRLEVTVTDDDTVSTRHRSSKCAQMAARGCRGCAIGLKVSAAKTRSRGRAGTRHHYCACVCHWPEETTA